jgi:hypothetical protein
MAKPKNKLTDEEALKHYTPSEGFPSPSGGGAAAELPALVKELLDKSLTSHPRFVKAEIAVDPVMTNRKSAVMRPKKGERRNAKNV